MPLPAGWVSAQLSSLASEIRGSVRPSAGTLYELYSVPAFPSGRPEIVDGAEVGSAKRLVASGDLLLCKINPRINRVWKVDADQGHPKLASTEYLVLRAPEDVREHLVGYLAWYFRSPEFRVWIELHTEGATGSHTRAKSPVILRHEVPLAPIAEQRRIVAAIEEQFSRIDAGIEALNRARRNLQRMRAAILEAALSGRLVQQNSRDEAAEAALKRLLDQYPGMQDGRPPGARRLNRTSAPPSDEPLPHGWAWVNLEMIAVTGSGGTPRRDRSEYFGGTMPWVKSGELRDGLVRETAEFLTNVGLANSSAQIVPRGTLMIALYGATVGKLGILDIEQAATNQAVCTIRPLIPEMRDYLWWVLRHHRNDLIFQGRGGAQPNISQEILRKFVFPLPPLAEQQRIVEQVERHWSVLRDVDTVIVANVHRSERLRRAMLSRAFQGRLVPKDPADESAALLLERIGVARTADGSKQHRSRRPSR